jgi:NAD(P)-dependent dehydrogenase (short-subunit alcohol dehydrogenase family)
MNEPTEFSLKNKAILVTGGAGLIGAEVCDAYAAYGASLVLTDLLPADALEERALRLREKYPGAQVTAIRADITSDASVRELFGQIEARWGGLDVLVNLAALDAKFDDRIGEINRSSFENYPLEVWQKSLDVNATGLVRVTQAAVRLMLPRRAGNIINVASTYSLVAPNPALYRTDNEASQTYKPMDYVLTKSMIPNFTRYLAARYARDGIRSNAIAPHGVDNRHPEHFKRNYAALSPLGRMCDVRELRGPFVFLASDATSYMTGSTLVVDGGWTAW